MKKSLIALAALSAFATAAQAQSSVSVYGIIDTGYGWKTNNGQDSTATAPSTYTQKSGDFFASQSISSRLGFKGTEDLGGGLKAHFVTESDINPVTTTTVIGNNRQSYVALESSSFGTVAVGYQYSPVHLTLGALSPAVGGLNNVVGDLSYKNGPQYTARANAVSWVKSFGPVTTAVAVGSAKDDQSTNTNDTNSSVLGGMVHYNGGAFNLMAATQTVKSGAATATADSTIAKQALAYNVATGVSFGSTAGTYGIFNSDTADLQAASAGTNGETKVKNTESLVGGTYRVGDLLLTASRIEKSVDNRFNVAGNSDKRTSTQVGAQYAVTPAVSVYGMAAKGHFTIQAANGNSPQINGSDVELTGQQIGAVYALSKRTQAYAIYGKQTAVVNNNASLDNNGLKVSMKQTAIGLRHSF